MKVAVIGGGGKMGAWFVRYFYSKGKPTILSDIRAEQARIVSAATGAERVETNVEAVKDADLALVSVAIAVTPSTILEIAPHMKEGAILAEVSSIKKRSVGALRQVANRHLQPLSIHPLFGPAAESLTRETIAVVPVFDEDAEACIAKKLFDGVNIVVTELAEHDRAMAVILSLTYFMNLAFVQALTEEDLTLLKKLSGTTFEVQLAIAESVASEDPDLVSSLMKENPFTELCLERYIGAVHKTKRLIESGSKDFIEQCRLLRTSLQRNPDYAHADERRYKAFKALRT